MALRTGTIVSRQARISLPATMALPASSIGSFGGIPRPGSARSTCSSGASFRTGARTPINAMAETVATKPYFREGYRKRRCIVPVDGFFEWTAVKGSKTKQPYAIAMRDRSPFGIAGVWENWRDPASGEWVRTFAIVTVPANSLVSRIHDRMPAILAPDEFEGWLSEDENPRNLMRPFDPDLMTMWPVTTRVNSPKNDDASLVEAVDLTTAQSGGPGGDASSTACPRFGLDF